jgi:hypothetical protein
LHIAPVRERSRFYSRAALTDGSYPPVEPRISDGTQYLRQRIRGERRVSTPLSPERVFTRIISYAEMTLEEKNGLSHRYRALAKLKEYLATLNQ